MSKTIKRSIGKSDVQQKTQRVYKNRTNVFSFFLTKTNYIFLAAGIIVSILGFYLSGSGNWDSSQSLVLAPVLLILAYAVLFPMAILYKKKAAVKVVENNTENAL